MSNHALCTVRNTDSDCVKPSVMQQFVPVCFEPLCGHCCQTLNTLSNSLQSHWTVPGRIKTSNVGQQCLSSADIAGCFFTTNMLLACLQRQTQCWAAFGIGAHSNQTTRQTSRVGLGCRHECGVRSTKTHRNTKTLCRANCDVGT